MVLAATRRIVFKVGSRLLTDMPDASEATRIEELVAALARVKERGYEVLLVSSGAIAAGMMLTETRTRPTDISQLQSLAALGQGRLMSLYERACQTHGFHCAQVLLSRDDVRDRHRHLNVRNCLHDLLSRGSLPVINENDVVSVDEICFGDNDCLAALVGAMMRAELTVMLTTTAGFRRREGEELGQRLALIRRLTPDLRRMAGESADATYSVGGMRSKLDAAEILLDAGESLWIADGHDFDIIDRLMNGADEGTLFLPATPQLSSSKRWLAFFAEPAGEVRVDAGAARTLRRQGSSLLPSGIIAVTGTFAVGDTVRIVDADGDAVAVGVTNYAASDLDRIQGKRSSQVAEIMGELVHEEVVHRDNLALVG